MVVDIPGGTTLTEKERTLFFRELPECWQYKFRNPTYRGHFEVVPRKTYSVPEGDGKEEERLLDEIASGDWMNRMQVWLCARRKNPIPLKIFLLPFDHGDLTNMHPCSFRVP